MNKRKILGLVIAGATIMSIGGISQSHIQKSNIENNVLLVQHNNNSNNNTNFSEHSVDGTVTVKCDNLWINSKPAANDGNLVVVTKGTQLHATAKSSNGWYKVNYDGLVGWIGGEPYSKFVPASGNQEKPQITTKGVNELVEVTAGGLCLNSEPEPNVGTMNILPHGAKVVATEVSSNGWYKVTYQGQTGWIGGALYSKVVEKYHNLPIGGLKTLLGKVEVTADGLCMNSKPEPNDGVITVLKKGTIVPYFRESKDNWYYVEYDGKMGWIGGSPYSKVVTTKKIPVGTPTATINIDGGIWLNKTPNDSHMGTMFAPDYAKVSILKKQGDWYEVNYQGGIGWVNENYLTNFKSESIENSKQYVTVTSPIGLWLNNGPSVNSGHILCLNDNTSLKVIGQENGWYNVEYNGITGWVDGQYVD